MGAWGTEPYDNDTAADWFGSLLKKGAQKRLDKRLMKALKLDVRTVANIGEFRAACHLLAALGNPYVWPGAKPIPKEAYVLAIDGLEALLNDRKWQSTWINPEPLRANLLAQISVLRSVQWSSGASGARARLGRRVRCPK